jgi:hypothetical protein
LDRFPKYQPSNLEEQLWRHEELLANLEQRKRHPQDQSSGLEQEALHDGDWFSHLNQLACRHQKWIHTLITSPEPSRVIKESEDWTYLDQLRHTELLVVHHEDWLRCLEQHDLRPEHLSSKQRVEVEHDLNNVQRYAWNWCHPSPSTPGELTMQPPGSQRLADNHEKRLSILNAWLGLKIQDHWSGRWNPQPGESSNTERLQSAFAEIDLNKTLALDSDWA